MSKSSGSGFASFKRAVSGGNKVGNDEKSSGEFQNTFFYIAIIKQLKSSFRFDILHWFRVGLFSIITKILIFEATIEFRTFQIVS